MNTRNVILNGAPLTSSEVLVVARDRCVVSVAEEVLKKLEDVRQRLELKIEGSEPFYGINTGFGALGKVSVDAQSLEQLQQNLIRSHATGVGAPLDQDVVRAMMLVLCASLCRGISGVRPIVVETLCHFLNQRLTPFVPRIGSVGASGDLAPLAHIALALMGEGNVLAADGSVVDSKSALQAANVKPIKLQAKEGLALINGTHLMSASGALLSQDFRRVFDASLVAAAMSFDACRATPNSLDSRIHEVRKHVGQQKVAASLLDLIRGSQIVESHKEDDPRVQDPYSFRCCPAVLGTVWESFRYFEGAIAVELGAVTDNPLLMGDAELDIVSGGNFHGMPLAVPLDTLAIAISHLAGISERRTFHMLSGIDPEAHLPTFMTPQAGLQSGLMISQYTAAACCNEIIGLATPASVANLSTSAGMEDYNSFGPRSAAKAARSLELARSVVAIELLCASNGIEHHRPLKSSEPIERAISVIRQSVAPLTEDRSPSPDIHAIERMIEAGEFELEKFL